MSDLVKTGQEIEELKKYLLECTYENCKKLDDTKYLVLPSGLDTLERMLKEELSKVSMGSLNEIEIFDDIVSSVFARFKKEHGIKEE